MQIYLPYDLEKKLRDWAAKNDRTISSVVVEGLGKVLYTTTAEKIAGSSKTTLGKVLKTAAEIKEVEREKYVDSA